MLESPIYPGMLSRRFLMNYWGIVIPLTVVVVLVAAFIEWVFK